MGEVYAGPGARTCAHSGCNWPAAATLGFDYDARQAWLEDLSAEEDPSRYDLCSIHADRFSPPRGWRSEDRRRLPEPIFHSPTPLGDVGEQEIRPEPTPSFQVADSIGAASPPAFPNQASLPDL